METEAWSFVFFRLLAIAAALVLVVIATRRYLRSRRGSDRFLRSLPAETVQAIADRLDSPEELTAFLNDFFGASYQGAEESAGTPETVRKLLPPELPEEEFADLLRTADAIEPDALLAYACKLPEHETPAIITVCRGGESDLLIGIFRPV